MDKVNLNVLLTYLIVLIAFSTVGFALYDLLIHSVITSGYNLLLDTLK